MRKTNFWVQSALYNSSWFHYWETKHEKYGEEFEQISKTIKEEMKIFDFNRVKEFKVKLVKYLESLLSSQEQLVSIWEQYLPQVKAI